MTLRLIYRSHGGENTKDRPGYYSKLLGLVSFVRALEEVDAQVTYLNDGPIPGDRMRLMEATGSIRELPSVGMRGSYTAALELATTAGSGEDVVWFGEDDYLYCPGALRALARAADTIPEADYFGLYGSTPENPARPATAAGDYLPAGWRDLPPWRVDGQDWVRIVSTTSTFGARAAALAEDVGIFRFCMVPHRTMLRDHDTMAVLQGFEPYRYGQLAREAVGMSAGGPRERVRGAWLAPFRLATNLRSYRRPERRRVIVAPDPNLATHMEVGWTAPGRNWVELAQDTTEWGTHQGFMTPVTTPS